MADKNYKTTEKLKSFLDTNQYKRENLCRGVAGLDGRFVRLRNVHPRGGPDGGKDFLGETTDGLLVFGAVGFKNQADDSKEDKKEINDKFKQDLEAALNHEPLPEVFLFFTNVDLTEGEKRGLKNKAIKEGFADCDIFDRERIKSKLNEVDGFALRSQYLDISMNKSEEKSFFNKWGRGIQNLVSESVGSLQDRLSRIEFHSVSGDPIRNFQIIYELEKGEGENVNPHFRIFCSILRRFHDDGVFRIVIGATDDVSRIDGADLGRSYKNAILNITWTGESIPDLTDPEFSKSSGHFIKDRLVAKFKDDWLTAKHPRLTVGDFEGASFIFFSDAQFAQRIKGIHIVSNGYLLDSYSRHELTIDGSDTDPLIPLEFEEGQLLNQWVRIRPSRGSTFQFIFGRKTPTRLIPDRFVKSDAFHQLVSSGQIE